MYIVCLYTCLHFSHIRLRKDRVQTIYTCMLSEQEWGKCFTLRYSPCEEDLIGTEKPTYIL